MSKSALLAPAVTLLLGCASNVHFVKTDEGYVPAAKPPGTHVEFKQGKFTRPHRVIGVVSAELGGKARGPELDALLVKKAREVGADGIVLVEYDVEREFYVEAHHATVGRGPWRKHIVTHRPRARVEKTATGIAVMFR